MFLSLFMLISVLLFCFSKTYITFHHLYYNYQVSRYLILLVFIFNYKSKSVIVIPLMLISSLRITFWTKVSYPVFDL